MAYKQELLEVWQSRKFQIWMDLIRIMLLVSVAIIIYILIKEIEAVKILAYNPCKICMNKTGAICNLPIFPPSFSPSPISFP